MEPGDADVSSGAPSSPTKAIFGGVVCSQMLLATATATARSDAGSLMDNPPTTLVWMSTAYVLRRAYLVRMAKIWNSRFRFTPLTARSGGPCPCVHYVKDGASNGPLMKGPCSSAADNRAEHLTWWWMREQRAWISTSSGLVPSIVMDTAELTPAGCCRSLRNSALGLGTGCSPLSSIVNTPTWPAYPWLKTSVVAIQLEEKEHVTACYVHPSMPRPHQ